MPLTTPQQKVIDSKARFRVLISGRRFGKTFVAINELARFARFPNQRCWYVAPSYRQAKQIVWTDLKEKIIKHRWHSKINDSDLSIILKNKSEIALRGADNFDALRGVGLNFLVMDEISDIKPIAWTEVLRPTLSNTEGHCLFCTSPKGFNWAYDLYVKGTKDNNWESFKFTTLDGGQVDVEEIEQAKNDLDERTFQQEYLATFVNYAGIIYYNFDINNNVVEDYKLHDGTIHIGMDFNIDPMCCVVAQEKDNKIIIFDEIQIWSSNTAEMVQEIKQRYKQKVVIYPDPASKQRKTSAGGFTDLSILKNAGFEVRCRSTHPLVRDRINAVNSKLKNVNGMSSLFMIKSCKNLIKSLQRQIYKEGTHGPDKDSGFDHFNDALGYMVEYMYPLRRDFKPNRPIRWS